MTNTNNFIEKAAYVAGVASVPFLALFVAPVYAVADMYNETISDCVNNKTPKMKSFGKYYKDCIKTFVLRAPEILRASVRNKSDKDIAEKKREEKIAKEILPLQGVINSVLKSPVFKLTLFEETEHQKRQMQRYETCNYFIDFGGDGTSWCGGIRGNGYVFKTSRKDGKKISRN